MPQVVFRSVNGTLAGKQVERRQFQVGQRMYRPAVSSVSLDIEIGGFLAQVVLFRQRCNLQDSPQPLSAP